MWIGAAVGWAVAWQALQTGSADVVLAGGMENMSQVPYVLPGARWGQRLGHGAVEDMMLLDGLWDCFYDCHMGMTAENLAEQYSIDRAMQDDFAVESQRRWGQAQSEGRFDDEIIPVSVEERGRTVVCSVDEHPRPDVTAEQLNELKPAFKKEGTVTAGNASGINDGAALLLLMRAETARSSGLKPLAYVRGVASAGVDPRIMGIGPAPAIRALLKRADLSLDRIGRVELNEAFAAQSIAVGRELDLDWERVNVNGGLSLWATQWEQVAPAWLRHSCTKWRAVRSVLAWLRCVLVVGWVLPLSLSNTSRNGRRTVRGASRLSADCTRLPAVPRGIKRQ